jgi:hypothetical protein
MEKTPILVPNAKQIALKSYSQIAQYTALSIIGGYQAIPKEWQDAIPLPMVLAMASVALVCGIVGRVLAQPGLTGEPAEKAQDA